MNGASGGAGLVVRYDFHHDCCDALFWPGCDSYHPALGRCTNNNNGMVMQNGQPFCEFYNLQLVPPVDARERFGLGRAT